MCSLNLIIIWGFCFLWESWICALMSVINYRKIVAIISSNDFSAFAALLLFDIFLQFTMVLIFLFCFYSFISVLYFHTSYCSLQVPCFFFFHLQNAIWYWEFLVNFSFQILHFFMSRSSIWILHHLFFSWLCCGFL